MHRTKTSFLAFFAFAASNVANLSWADDQSSRVIDSDSPNQRLNIVFILVDDLGKEWIQCYGGEDIQTPHIDDLAATGMKFTNAYSMPQCTPSRACFLTGQYPFRNGWVNHWDVPRWGVGYFDWKLNPCIANALKAAGYQTAIAGKWQINDFRVHPNCLVEMGFDEFCMWTGCETDPDNRDHERRSTRRYWDPYIHTKQGSRTYDGQFGPDIYNQFVLDFITKNSDRPFFVYYPMALTHTPLVHTPLEPNATTPIDKHKAMVRYTDHLLGKLTDHLNTLGILEHTLIIWTTDNGTARGIKNRRNGLLVDGGKGRTTENGVNAPFIANCPQVIPRGTTTDALVDFTDLYPTFSKLAGLETSAKHKLDGFPFDDVLNGSCTDSNRRWIMAMGGQPGVATEAGIENVFRFRDRVIRDKQFKLFIDSRRTPQKLIDLANDPKEETDLMDSPEHMAIAKKLSSVIEHFPVTDADPKYARIKYPAYKKTNLESQRHKKP